MQKNNTFLKIQSNYAIGLEEAASIFGCKGRQKSWLYFAF